MVRGLWTPDMGNHFVFMPPPLGAVGIMFSGCPSIRLSNWPPDSSLPGRRTNQLTFRLSVHPQRFPDIFLRMHGRNDLKFGVLLYPDHLQNWLDFGHSLLIFLLLMALWLTETGHIWGFRSFSGGRSKRGGGSVSVFLTLCVEFCLVNDFSWMTNPATLKNAFGVKYHHNNDIICKNISRPKDCDW